MGHAPRSNRGKFRDEHPDQASAGLESFGAASFCKSNLWKVASCSQEIGYGIETFRGQELDAAAELQLLRYAIDTLLAQVLPLLPLLVACRDACNVT